MTTPRPRPGTGPCPDCQERVLFALLVSGDLVALSNGKDGPWAVRWDITRTPRGRQVPDDYQTAEGEHRFRPHSWSCKALAPVRSIATAKSLRRHVERRHAIDILPRLRSGDSTYSRKEASS